MAAVDVFNAATTPTTTTTTTSETMPFVQSSIEQSLANGDADITSKLFEALELDDSDDSSIKGSSLEGSNSSVDDSAQMCKMCK